MIETVNVFSKTERERVWLSVPALIDIVLLAFIFSFAAGKYIVAPGLLIDLDSSETLPKISAPDYAVADADLSVLTATGTSMLIFDGAIYDMKSFEKKIAAQKPAGTTLLIKADKNLTVQSLVEIAEAAKAGGYKKIQLAAKPK